MRRVRVAAAAAAPGEAFSRQNEETWKLDSIHTDPFTRCYPYLAQFRLHSQSVVMTTSMIHACCNAQLSVCELVSGAGLR